MSVVSPILEIGIVKCARAAKRLYGITTTITVAFISLRRNEAMRRLFATVLRPNGNASKIANL
jgi:hypothetical protein